MISRLGMIGAGHLAGFLAEGLRNANWNGRLIIPDRPSATGFGAQFGAEIAPTSQHVIESAELVIVAVRPAQVEAALAGLVWPNDRILLSVMAGVKLGRLSALAPKATTFRAMPISAAAIGASPTPIFPSDTAVEELLNLLGPTIPMKSEASLEAASANAAAYGWYFRLIDGLVSANRKAGLDETAAKRIAVSTLIAAGRVALEAQRDGEEILESLATPGGITTQGLAILEENDAFDPWSQAFEAVSDRLMSG